MVPPLEANTTLRAPGAPRPFEDAQRTDDVDLGVEHGVSHRDPHVDLGSQVEDHFRLAPHHQVDEVGRANVQLVKIEAPAAVGPSLGQVGERSRRQVVHHVHRLAFGQKAVHQGRPDETGPTGDECPVRDFHHVVVVVSTVVVAPLVVAAVVAVHGRRRGARSRSYELAPLHVVVLRGARRGRARLGRGCRRRGREGGREPSSWSYAPGTDELGDLGDHRRGRLQDVGRAVLGRRRQEGDGDQLVVFEADAGLAVRVTGVLPALPWSPSCV